MCSFLFLFFCCGPRCGVDKAVDPEAAAGADPLMICFFLAVDLLSSWGDGVLVVTEARAPRRLVICLLLAVDPEAAAGADPLVIWFFLAVDPPLKLELAGMLMLQTMLLVQDADARGAKNRALRALMLRRGQVMLRTQMLQPMLLALDADAAADAPGPGC
ncbi:hypothetical protein NDU88_000057 [Pleurodeles waltl]|uniref:Secreted protein n=1 Tax=Pleurodeles waltl TaxID=8319 RepID=A0AAV7NAT5_PLEWA|nr:hypothetical protein NDU88_000057 [Pleurodeles waltl]